MQLQAHAAVIFTKEFHHQNESRLEKKIQRKFWYKNFILVEKLRDKSRRALCFWRGIYALITSSRMFVIQQRSFRNKYKPEMLKFES